MTTPEFVLLAIFVTFITACGIYVARTTKRQKAHHGINPMKTRKLEEDQARAEDGPSRR